MGFLRQEYWSGLPCPPPGDLPDLEIKPVSFTSPALTHRFFTTSVTWEAHCTSYPIFTSKQFHWQKPVNTVHLKCECHFPLSQVWEGLLLFLKWPRLYRVHHLEKWYFKVMAGWLLHVGVRPAGGRGVTWLILCYESSYVEQPSPTF